MISSFQKWDKLQKNWQEGPVIYLASTEASLLREAENFVLHRWQEEGHSLAARLDGPVPDMGELIAATGSISLFGGTRHVLLRELSPSSLSDKDAKELQTLFSDLENAVLLLTVLYKDKRTATSKKAKSLAKEAVENGFFVELSVPTKRENLEFLHAVAAECGNTRFAPAAAEALLERVKENRVQLKNETEKLAAFSGYTEIDTELVRRYGARNTEADVFELLRFITAGQTAMAQGKLAELFLLKNEPVAISAALGGSFVDMLRVRIGSSARKSSKEIHAQMHYSGSDYRLIKAKENAAVYTTEALRTAVLMLTKLDKSLKSSALPDKRILLQAAVAELLLLRQER